MIATMSNELHAFFYDGSAKSLGKNETLFFTGGSVQSMYFVSQGQVDLVRHTQSGTRILLFWAGEGKVLAEASAYSETYHCDGTASEPSQVLAIPVTTFRARLDQDTRLASLWAAQLARGLQAARMNSAIKTMRTVDERLDAWLDDGRAIPNKGEWQLLAQALGVTREALYRAMAKRR
jgi:CRP/FNR family transcriptional regulator, dissimilatory nitrate respiration regulator